MDYILNKTYFENGDLHIGEIGYPEVQAKLDWFIKAYEPEFLRLVLGSTVLYNDFKSALAAVTTLDDLPEPWLSFTKGGDFMATFGFGSSQLEHWPGLADLINSPLARYVYYNYTRSEAKFLVGSGTAVPLLENATRVDVSPLHQWAWSDMIRLNKLMFQFISSHLDQFPGWPYHSFSGRLFKRTSIGYASGHPYWGKAGPIVDLFTPFTTNNL